MATDQDHPEIIRKLEESSRTRLGLACGPQPQVPLPLRWFAELYNRVDLYCSKSDSGNLRNSWQIGPVANWNFMDVFMAVYHGEIEKDLLYLKSTRVIANSAFDGSAVVALDVSEIGFGNIISCSYNNIVDGGGMPIIAHSFEEWLARTLAVGPESQCPYWEMPGFNDLGPAIPNDPYYQPIGKP